MTFGNILVVICLVAFVLLKPIRASNSTKCHRVCLCLDSTIVDCSSRNLSSVPDDLPSNTTVLLLNNNQIGNLPSELFGWLPHLTKVELSGNKLNCDCSLTWVKNGSTNVQVIATCHEPTWIRGRPLSGVTVQDMCRTCKTNTSIHDVLNIQPRKVDYRENDIVSLSCPKAYIINGPTYLICQADGSWNSDVFPHCQERCKIDASKGLSVQPPKPYYEKDDVITISCPPGYVIVGPASLKCLQDGVTWNNPTFPFCKEIPSTTPAPITTVQSTVPTTTPWPTPVAETTTKATTTEELTTTTQQAVTTSEMLTSTVELTTTANTPQLTTTKHATPEIQTSTKAQPPLPTRWTDNVTASPTPTTRSNVTSPRSLNDLIELSDKKDLSAKSLMNLVEMLENDVGRNHSDSTTTKNFLLVSDKLIRDDNRKMWSTVNESFPERLLQAVTKAMRLQATEMLTSNGTQHFLVNYDNLEAEIQVDSVKNMKLKGMQFPSSRISESDYIQLQGLASNAIENNTNLALIGVKSSQLGNLLPQRSLIDGFPGSSVSTSSGLLSASVLSLNSEISLPVRIVFRNKNFLGKSKENTKCVFWQYEDGVVERKNAETSRTSKSGWSDEGCEVVSRNKTTTICHCNHTTDFSVLSTPVIPLVKEIVDPSIIVYIAGLCLLIGAVIAFIRNIVVFCHTKRERLFVLLNECLALVLTAIVFLLGIFLDYNKEMCMVFAALLHLLVLAVFSWILTEVIQLYLCVNFGWKRGSSRSKYFVILGWVIPVVLVAITLAATRQKEYGSTQWCWYSDSHIIILLTYVCPVVLCFLVSVIFILKIVFIKSDATDEAERKDLSVILTLSGFLLALVLCTFITAALSADRPEEKVFQYLFAAFCILLAIYIAVYHCVLDKEIMKLSVRKNVQRARPKRDYYSTKETVMYSEDTSEGKSFSLIFPSRKSPTKKPGKNEKRSAAKRSDSSSPFDYDSTVPMFSSANDSSLKSFKSQVSTQQHTLDTPPNTLSAITISRPNSQCIELTSLSDLDRRPDGAEQTDSAEPSEFYGSRYTNPLDKERQRTSGCSTDCTNATTFGKEKVAQKPADVPNNNSDIKNRISGASSAGLSGTSRSSVSGASVTAAAAAEENEDDEAFENQPFIRCESNAGPEIRSDPPSKIPKRRKRGSRRRLDDEYHDDDNSDSKIQSRQSSTLPTSEGSVKLKQYTSF